MSVTVTHSKTLVAPDSGSEDKVYGSDYVSATSHTVVVDNNTLVAAKLAASATDVLFGRSTAAAGAGEEIACTAAGRALLDDAAASNQRTTLGLGTIATQDANNVSVSGGSVTGTTGAEYTLQFLATSGNPADASTYFIGMSAALTSATGSGILRIPFPLSGTVIRVDVHVGVGGTLGTTEQSTMSFRLNNTSDTTISAVVQANANSQFYNSGAISVAVVAGDYFEIKWVTPTWVTNPTVVVVNGCVTVRR